MRKKKEIPEKMWNAHESDRKTDSETNRQIDRQCLCFAVSYPLMTFRASFEHSSSSPVGGGKEGAKRQQ